MFKVVEPYSHYRTGADNVILSVKAGRHGTLKATFELGEEVLKKAGWVPGRDYVDLYVGMDSDAGLARFQKGTSYKVRSIRGKTGHIIVPAAALSLTKKMPREVCEWNNDSAGRLYVIIKEAL